MKVILEINVINSNNSTIQVDASEIEGILTEYHCLNDTSNYYIYIKNGRYELTEKECDSLRDILIFLKEKEKENE